uniref:Uncharacterized protein n=1 Tax=Avena sativa TaxID=4498 RepID=A0ACD5W3B3_AVESA
MAGHPPPPPPNPTSQGPSTPLRAPPTTTTSPLLTPSAFAPAVDRPLYLSTTAAALSSPLASIFINQHVPFVLTLNPPNYTQWRTLFEVVFAKFGVTDHIDDPPRAAAAYWLQDDAHVVSWLYNRVSQEIFGLVHQRNATAATIWSSIATLFLENAEHQVVFLATDFRRIEQGTGSVISYFARLKECADRLADLGEHVTDRDQVLNMFRGLAPRLQYAIPILTMQRPLPSFLACRSFLLLEESRQSTHSDTFPDAALHAARAPSTYNPGSASSGGGGSGSGGGGSGSGSSSGNRNNSGGNRNYGYKGKGKAPAYQSGGGGASSSTAAPVRPPAAPAGAPWTGLVHAWAMPWRPHAPGSGILGSRPGAPAPFAGSASHYPAAPGGASASYGVAAPHAPSNGGPAWDQTALIHALNTLSGHPQQPPPAGAEWYFDTGATSHMASSSAMQEEYRALMANRTWTLVPRPPGANIVTGKWVFRHKLKADGALERYKARWVVRGFSQRPGVDFDETFSPVVKSATIRAVLTIAASREWPVHQMDVNNAFLQGQLTKRVYCQQPSGFVDDTRPDHVCLLDKSLYGLKQAPRAWFDRFTAFLCTIGFTASRSDPSLFIYNRGGDTAYLLLYVDDIVLRFACLHMHAPRDRHLALVKRILRYLRGTTAHGLHLHRSSTLDLLAYSDADWAGCPDTRRSTSGYAIFLGDALISWSSKRQPTVSRSSAEAEYRAVANVVAESCWLRQLLGELHVHLQKATVVYCNNISSVYMAANPMHHRRTKHIELDIHFVREKVALGELRVLHVPTSQQFADVMTKGLPTSAFEEFRSSLCIRPPDAPAAAGCQLINYLLEGETP